MTSRHRPQHRLLAALVPTIALLCSLLAPGATPAAHAAPAPAAAAPAAVHTAVVGQPPRSYVIPATSHFSFPNRSTLERLAIRNRVLYTIQSVWGGPRNSLGTPMPGNGSIRIATWSFSDWAVARSLVAARNRGVSVQVVAASTANQDSRPWQWLRKRLGANLYRPGHPITREMYSFARQCRGACRGVGGTPHAKYFLFDDVGARHARDVVVQTSMNLTRMAYAGQWNQAQVLRSPRIYADYLRIYRQMRLGRPVTRPYHVYAAGNVIDFFFPKPGTTATTDPVMQILNRVSCTGSLAAGTSRGRTKIRIIQYAMYDTRGLWIARKLRYLHDRGCDVGIIYSLMTRPVLQILRSTSGRGRIPMRQSVVKDSAGTLVKYNHSKWMTISGHWGSARAAYLTFTGSANWANLAFGSDEQMQRISSRPTVARYDAVFNKTWRQRTSSTPSFGRVLPSGRVLTTAPDVPEDQPQFGVGALEFLTED